MKKMKKSRAALIAVGLLVIVLIAGVLVWFFIFRQDYNDDDFFDPKMCIRDRPHRSYV